MIRQGTTKTECDNPQCDNKAVWRFIGTECIVCEEHKGYIYDYTVTADSFNELVLEERKGE